MAYFGCFQLFIELYSLSYTLDVEEIALNKSTLLVIAQLQI